MYSQFMMHGQKNIKLYIYIYIYRMFQKECVRLRENVS